MHACSLSIDVSPLDHLGAFADGSICASSSALKNSSSFSGTVSTELPSAEPHGRPSRPCACPAGGLHGLVGVRQAPFQAQPLELNGLVVGAAAARALVEGRQLAINASATAPQWRNGRAAQEGQAQVERRRRAVLGTSGPQLLEQR